VAVASLSDAITREARMAQDRTAEVSEAEIAVHWQEEDYVRPPKTFVTQANLKDAAGLRVPEPESGFFKSMVIE
jgi:hypothetical protein